MTKVLTAVPGENMETMYQNDVAVDLVVTVILGAHPAQEHPRQDGVNLGQYVDEFLLLKQTFSHFDVVNGNLCPILAQ